MDLTSIIDFTDSAVRDIGRYKIQFVLNAAQLSTKDYAVSSLTWDSVCYGENELHKVPDDKRGIYAFVICHTNDVLPTHGYVMYIGIAGRDSNRPLRARYKDYLNPRKLMKRATIAVMIGNWHKVLRFFFAPVDTDVSSSDLKTLERQLNSALLPPYSKGDLEANIKAKRSAFP